MLSLGLAISYAPAMFREAADWPAIRRALTGDAPEPFQLGDETGEVVQSQAQRIRASLDAIRGHLEDARIDAVVMLGSDSGRVFSGIQVPQLCTYLGDDIWGSTRLAELGEDAEDDIVRLRCAPEVAGFLHAELVDRGFDVSYSRALAARGQPEYGTIPEFVAPAASLLLPLGLPIVPIYVNAHVAPMPSGRRCYALGQAMAGVLDERPERVALLASGGMSQDHFGSRAGWIDEPLDRWVLDRLARGKGADLQRMFDVESDTLRGGASRIRLWAIVAGAAEARGAHAAVIDYIPSYSAAAGIGFACWPIPNR